MNIRELSTLDHIMGFKGEYAVFKTQENGRTTQGLINRKGEIVWDAHSIIPILKVADTTFIGMPMNSHNMVYYDIVNRQEVERPAYKLLIDGGYFLRGKKSKWALFVDGKQVTDFIYDDVIRLENLVPTQNGKDLCVRQRNKSFYIDRDGNRISKEYDYLEPCTQAGYALAKIDDKIWVITENELPLNPTKWADTWCKIKEEGEAYHLGLKWITPNWLQFAEGDKWGIMNPYGGIELPCVYDSIYVNDDQKTFILNKSGFKGVMCQESIITKSYDWLIPCKYQHLLYCEGFYIARINNKMGIIDGHEKIIIPFEYESLMPARDEKLNLLSAKKDGECFFMNAEQKRIELF